MAESRWHKCNPMEQGPTEKQRHQQAPRKRPQLLKHHVPQEDTYLCPLLTDYSLSVKHSTASAVYKKVYEIQSRRVKAGLKG